MSLPLLQLVSNEYPTIDLSQTLIIGCQHILGTTFDLFESCFEKGLQPENLFLIGKCYSTNKETFDRFSARGVHISQESFLFDSHRAFDDVFDEVMENFFQSICLTVDFSHYEKIIILDDGGHLIALANSLLKSVADVVAIEQTTAGYEKIKNLPLRFPVMNVARSRAKLEIESLFIAESLVERIEISFEKYTLNDPRILVIGAGAIGIAMTNLLRQKYTVACCDIISDQCDYQGNYRSHIHEFDVIIGATGTTVLSKTDFLLLKPGVLLVSASSSDREFSAVDLRASLPRIPDCHQDLEIQNIRLLNCGFPMNFNDGARDCVPPEKIQLTRALLLSSIFISKNESLHLGIVELDGEIQQRLIEAL